MNREEQARESPLVGSIEPLSALEEGVVMTLLREVPFKQLMPPQSPLILMLKLCHLQSTSALWWKAWKYEVYIVANSL